MTEQTIKPKKKVDLGAIAFMRVNKLSKEVQELRDIVERIPPTPEVRDNRSTI